MTSKRRVSRRPGHRAYQDDHLLGVLHLAEKYKYDKARSRTCLSNNGLAIRSRALFNQTIVAWWQDQRCQPPEHRVPDTAATLRKSFIFASEAGGAGRIQPETRPPPRIIQVALEITADCFYTRVGIQSDDVADVRIRSYQAILDGYILPLAHCFLFFLLRCLCRPREASFMRWFVRTTAVRIS